MTAVCSGIRELHAAWLAQDQQLWLDVDDVTRMAGPRRASAPHVSVSHEAGSTPELGAGLPVLVPSTVSTPFGDSGPGLGGWGREGTFRPAGGQGRARTQMHVSPGAEHPDGNRQADLSRGIS